MDKQRELTAKLADLDAQRETIERELRELASDIEDHAETRDEKRARLGLGAGDSPFGKHGGGVYRPKGAA